MMNRRLFVVAAPLALIGCQTFTDQDVASAAQKAAILAQGARGLLSALVSAGIRQLTPDIIAKCDVAIVGMSNVATSLAGAATKAAALPLVDKLATYVSAVLSALSTVMPFLPAPLRLAITAMQVLLPFIQTLVGMFVPKAAPGTMTEGEATAILVGYGSRYR